MAVFTDGITSAYVVNNVQAKLAALRRALEDVADLQSWLAGLSQADLVALGISPNGASQIMSAVADANALAQIFESGMPPGTYPQPASAYVYANSIRACIGPVS